MKERRIFTSVSVLVVMLVLAVGLTQAQAPDPQAPDAPEAVLSSAFTYQGQLSDGGALANGVYDFQFILYDALTGGNQVGSTLTKGDVTVTDGLFIVSLNFGQIYNNMRLWLEISVRAGSSTDTYTILSPRQEVTPAPYALYSRRAGSLTSPDGTPADAFTVTNDGYLRVQNVAPIRLIRYENRGDSANFSTGVSATDYYCVAAGWSAAYDINENDVHNNMVWTYVSSGIWYVRVNFSSHNNAENPDVDIICFRKEIVSWEGAATTLNDPD